MTEITITLVRLGILLVVSHGAGYLVEKFFRLPRVLGEMGVGILLGFNLLGRLPILFGHHLFTPEVLEHDIFKLVVYMATIILLFNAGMHTDIRFFIKFFLKGSLVGFSGVVISFIVASMLTVIFVPNVHHMMDPVALFMGIATATSVGVSARILSEKNKISSIEGNISVTAAVLDDVAGIILLAIVVPIAKASNLGSAPDVHNLLLIAGKEVFAWAFLTVVGVMLARLIGQYLRILTLATIGMSAVGFVLIMGGIAESLGLSAVIGAYVLGLGFGTIDTSAEISEKVNELSMFFVPVFFAITGIGIDFSVMKTGILFSILYAFGSLFAKVFACGAASGLVGFNFKGMQRVGVIMMPRGEVTLVVANIGVAMGVLTTQLFGTLAFTVFISVLLTPFLLMLVFKDDVSGYKRELKVGEKLESFTVTSFNEITRAYFMDKIINFFQNSGYFIHMVDGSRRTYQCRKENLYVLIHQNTDGSILFSTSRKNMSTLKFLVLEEINDMQKELTKIKDITMENNAEEKKLMTGLIQDEV